jgi:hypothetical protein
LSIDPILELGRYTEYMIVYSGFFDRIVHVLYI